MEKYALPGDPMSDALDLVRLRADLVSLSVFREPWGVAYPHGPSHLHVVQEGTVTARLSGDTAAVNADTGDILLFPRGVGHELSDRRGSPAVPLGQIADAAYDPATIRFSHGGDGAETRLLCCRFDFRGPYADQLLAALPPIIHVRGPAEWLDISVRFLVMEAQHLRPGSAVMISRLVDLLFVQTLRAWADSRDHDLGWLGGLSDARIGRALAAIHAAPARRWSALELASIAGLSRSAFAERFTTIVGVAPIAYLTRWRMNLAADLLDARPNSVGDVARRIGYASDAAFNRAFKAQFGSSPAQFRRRDRVPDAGPREQKAL